MKRNWIKVIDGVPVHGQRVLFWDKEDCSSVPCLGILSNSGEWIDESSVDNCGDPIVRYSVTHWMFLPEPPK
jgi:hypothetical protein